MSFHPCLSVLAVHGLSVKKYRKQQNSLKSSKGNIRLFIFPPEQSLLYNSECNSLYNSLLSMTVVLSLQYREESGATKRGSGLLEVIQQFFSRGWERQKVWSGVLMSRTFDLS